LQAPSILEAASLRRAHGAAEGAPVADLDEIYAVWSEGDTFDNVLAELLSDRAERWRWSDERGKLPSVRALPQ
jgi:hypothetical protein